MAMSFNNDVISLSKVHIETAPYGIAFNIDINSESADQDTTHTIDLQNAFLKFKKKQIHRIKTKKKKKKQFPAIPVALNSKEKLELRGKFISKLYSYIGTPYARRYHTPDCIYYKRELFLDCCGLVRRVLRDLCTDFQFCIGPWNQAYMYDTLPIKLASTDEMQPGDLVFVSATYFDNNRKRQIHDMVHVEVWLGDGDKTIGSRWFKGTVQVLESYRFVSKSYYNMEYHFCSIDTWLEGVCHSFCPDHKWITRPSTPPKHSIFNEHLSCGQCDST
ncbi:hypothetical protein LOD99_4345 [Oopsacas minuta]|uniref:NlpC/P60 domain-containing protein n=1 Tax=Oopsacas minuta TaxID=111878 RepID=A0AAV7JV24_9METZ|nr:hypothetical protein LOD99_4345 [Oopsacas minuta]